MRIFTGVPREGPSNDSGVVEIYSGVSRGSPAITRLACFS